VTTTVEYIFGFDATAHAAPDLVYEGLAAEYALSPEMQLSAAAAIRCPALVMDSEDPLRATANCRALADRMRGTYVRLTDPDEPSVVRLFATAR
jgi:Mg-chelatase subunit ChlD